MECAIGLTKAYRNILTPPPTPSCPLKDETVRSSFLPPVSPVSLCMGRDLQALQVTAVNPHHGDPRHLRLHLGCAVPGLSNHPLTMNQAT